MSSNVSRNKTNQNIQVYVRVRPTNDRERAIRSMEMVETSNTHKEIIVRQAFDNKMTKKFTFDKTFGPESKQADIYQCVVAPLIEEVLAGYNCTVFAYGQTGTGKTHTMIGDETPSIGSSWEDHTDVGIIPRSLSHLFEELRLMEVEFSMRISYLELYNEELCDLLSTSDTQIRIFDDVNKKGSIIVQGLEEIPVHSASDVYKLLAKGQERRKTAATLMNAQSSRSHTIFSILVHIKENGIDGEELLKIGKLNLVDLAGSENISKAGNEKGIRTRETVNINQSLLTLGRVITALVERTPHIPYRESKLTRLLQESLGGRTKTSIIATVSPGHKDLEETLSTLEYAHRAKNIQNKPELNQKLTKKTVLKEYTEEIDRLKRDLIACREKNGIYLAEDTYNDMLYQLDTQNKELNEKMLAMKSLRDECTNKERLFLEVSSDLLQRNEELTAAIDDLYKSREKLNKLKWRLGNIQKCYEEKKHLLDCHVKTEELLTKQAHDLKTVANDATNDTYRLHDTIDRRKDVDRKIQSVCTNFEQSIQNVFTQMNCNVETLIKQFTSQYNIIKSELLNNTSKHQEFSTKTLNELNNVIELKSNSLNEFDTTLKTHTDFILALSEDQRTQMKNLFKYIIDMQQTASDDLNGEIDYQKEKLLTDKQSSDELFQIILELVNNISKTNQDFLQMILKKSVIFTREMKDEIRINQQNISESLEKTESVHMEFESIIEQMQKLLIKSRQNNHLKNMVPHLQEIDKKIDINHRLINSDIENHLEISHKNLDELNRKCDQFKQDNLRNYTESIENFSKFIQLNSQSVQETNETINKLNIIGNKCKLELDDRICKLATELQTVQQTTNDQLTINFNSIKQNVNDEQIRQSEHETQNNALTDLLRTSLEDFTVIERKDIEKGTEYLNDFYQNEFRVYSSTGETPVRHLFKYPTELAATSPHDRIVKRFWENRGDNNNNELLNSSGVILETPKERDYELNRRNLSLRYDEESIKSKSYNVLKPIENIPSSNMDYNIILNKENLTK